MKKINSSGFILAETLVVTVFLMAIFAMMYSSFMPLVGEYEKRENYDTVDGKYAAYWIKRMIEDPTYNIPSSKANDIKDKGYVRFQCSDISTDSDDGEKREFCINMVKNLEVDGCNGEGNDCEIYITRYRLDDPSDSDRVWFKQAIKATTKKYQENCSGSNCRRNYINACLAGTSGSASDNAICEKKADRKVFRSGFTDYVFNLPDYMADSLNYANYRVIVTFHNKKDNNNYYSYATIEVNR